MALSQLRMHHLRTGALPPRTSEECIFLASEEGAPPVKHADTCPHGCVPLDMCEFIDAYDAPLKVGEPITAPGSEPTAEHAPQQTNTP